MDKLLSPHIPTIGLAFTIAGIIVGLFRWANNTVSDEIKVRVAQWILGEHDTIEWNRAAIEVYGIVFGRQWWAIRSVLVVVSLTMLVGVSIFVWLNVLTDRAFPGGDPKDWWIVTPALAIFSVPIAFASSVKTRFLFEKIANSRHFLTATGWLLTDFALFVGISYGWIEVLTFLDGSFNESTSISEDIGNAVLGVAMTMSILPFVMAAALGATILPSFLGCMAFGIFFLKLAYAISSRMSGRLSKIVSKKRLENEPVILIGEALAGLSFLIICAAGVS